MRAHRPRWLGGAGKGAGKGIEPGQRERRPGEASQGAGDRRTVQGEGGERSGAVPQFQPLKSGAQEGGNPPGHLTTTHLT